MSFNTVPFNPFPPSSEQQGRGSYELPIAAADTLGGIKVGDNLTVEEDGTLNAPAPYTLPTAAADTLGGIKVGDNLTVEEDGTLNAPTPYTLPTAAADTLGGIKVGSRLSIDGDTGVLSADSQIVDYSTTEQATGQKWIDGKDIYSKVISLGNLPNTTEKRVSAGISGASVIMIEGYYDTGAAVSNLFNITALTNFVYNATSDEIVINVSSDLSAVTAFAILYYTKPAA